MSNSRRNPCSHHISFQHVSCIPSVSLGTPALCREHCLLPRCTDNPTSMWGMSWHALVSCFALSGIMLGISFFNSVFWPQILFFRLCSLQSIPQPVLTPLQLLLPPALFRCLHTELSVSSQCLFLVPSPLSEINCGELSHHAFSLSAPPPSVTSSGPMAVNAVYSLLASAMVCPAWAPCLNA